MTEERAEGYAEEVVVVGPPRTDQERALDMLATLDPALGAIVVGQVLAMEPPSDAIAALLEHPDVRPLLPGLVARGTLEVDPGTYAGFCEVCSQLGLEEYPGGVPAIVDELFDRARMEAGR